MRLSVIIPAYNEADHLPATLEDAYAWLRGHFDGTFEILVVDDGSRDATADSVEALMGRMPEMKLIRQPVNHGKGAAVRRGMLEADGAVRLFMDADHATHISELAKVLPVIQVGADVVIGSRQHPDSEIAQHQPWLREHMGKAFNLMMRIIIGLEMKDSQCGFKVFTTEAAQEIFSRQQLDGFSFDVEVLYLAAALQFNTVDIPVRWVNEPNSKVRILLDPLVMFIDLLRIRMIHF